MYDKSESRAYDKTASKYKEDKVKYIGTLIYMKKCVAKCSKCNEAFELFNVAKYIGYGSETEIEF